MRDMPDKIYAGKYGLHVKAQYGCKTKYIRADLYNTRATDCPAVDDCIKASPADNYDDLKKQFCALKTIVNCKSKELSFYKDKDYKLSEDRLRKLEASLENEREMNAQLTKELDDHLASRNLIRTIPDNMGLVPREPTDAMKTKGAECFDMRPSEVCKIYKAMIKAYEEGK